MQTLPTFTIESTRKATWELIRLCAFTITCEAVLSLSSILFLNILTIIPQVPVGYEIGDSQQGT